MSVPAEEARVEGELDKARVAASAGRPGAAAKAAALQAELDAITTQGGASAAEALAADNTKAELQALAKAEGVSVKGSKAAIAEAIVAARSQTD